MATFGRRLSRLRQRAAAVPTEPGDVVVTTTGTESPIGNIFARGAIGIAARAAELARKQVGYTAPSRVTSAVPPSRTDMRCKLPYVWNAHTQQCVLPRPGTAINGAGFTRPSVVMTAGGKGAKVPSVVANGIRAAEALPSQTGIGPAVETDSFWRQLVTTGLEKVLGPATTPTRPSPQPGVYDDDFALSPPAGGMPGWVIPAALIGGFLLLRR